MARTATGMAWGAALVAAGRAGWIDERRVTMEILTAIKRAGANQIISYHAKAASRWLREEYGAVPEPVLA